MHKKNFIAIFLIVFTMMLSSFAFYTYQMLYTPNILVEKEDRLFAISKGSTFSDVRSKMYKKGILNDPVSFSFLARLKGYSNSVRVGMYQLTRNMTNMQAINLLRSGSETPVKITFSHARLLSDLSEPLTRNLETDSATMAKFLLDDTTATYYGFKPRNFISMFIPNTYEVYWSSSPKTILDRMKREYDLFWSEERKQKAKKLRMTREEVATLASIVQSETNKPEEAERIAGVYINRLKRRIKLQADPTLIFAMRDFNIQRVLNKDKGYDSPYNTYKYYGLPPGPVSMPSQAMLDAVLNYEVHSYLYFCAKEDFSGYHVFARTLKEHNKNARRFQRALNKEKIFR